MLNGIHLVNFGNHRDTKVYFGKITALVGANGTGKTTVMRGVEWLKAKTLKDQHSFIRAGQKKLVLAASWPGQRNPKSIDIGLVNDGDLLWIAHKRENIETSRRTWLPSEHTETKWIKDPYADASTDVTWRSAQPGSIEVISDAYSHARVEIPEWTARYFKTSAPIIQKPSPAEHQVPRLTRNGSNLAAYLSSLITFDPDKFEMVRAAIREVLPLVRRVRVGPAKIEQVVKQTITINRQERSFEETREVPGHALIFDMVSGGGIPAEFVSEGTLLVLAILTFICGEDEADMIMLDDIELGLHPRAQRDLMRQLKKIQELKPDLQILVSTHSPYIVDELPPEDVWLFTTDEEGCAVTKRLSDHPDAKKALKVLTTGEFWSSQGEKWVAERPEKEKRIETAAMVAEDEVE